MLVVEDEEDARDVVTMLLEGSGAQVTTASSATEALVQIEGRMPDLIVADIGLPDEDGYAFIARVREREGGQVDRVPALALTAAWMGERCGLRALPFRRLRTTCTRSEAGPEADRESSSTFRDVSAPHRE